MPKRLESTPTQKTEHPTLFDMLRDKPLPEALMMVFNTIAQAMGKKDK